ncbi:MAG TPA: TadE family protein [Anaerolineae bacterium]|nr:TadE family protein [Anaerolineae bacterium]
MSILSRRSLRKPAPTERGQSLVEFALMLPVLLTMLMGTLDIGRMYFAYIAIQNAAGEGALYAAIHPNCARASDGPQCADPNNAEFRAIHESPGGAVDWTRVTIEVEPADRSGLREGDPITIQVRYQYDILTPVISPLVTDGKLGLTARAVQNVLDLEP